MEERKVAGVIVDEKTAEAQTKAAMDELMGVDNDSRNMKFEKMWSNFENLVRNKEI